MNYLESKDTNLSLNYKAYNYNYSYESDFISSQLCDVRAIAKSQGIDFDSTFTHNGKPLLFQNSKGNLQISYNELGHTIGTKFVCKPTSFYCEKESIKRRNQSEKEYGTLLASETSQAYFRERLNTAFKSIKKGKKTPKYLSPKKSSFHAYLTAFNQLFINPKTKHFTLEKGKPLYIVEGEKKAIALCLRGIPTIAISGINCLAHTEKLDKHYTITDKQGNVKKVYQKNYKTATFVSGILQVINRFEPSEIVLLHDSDNLDNENDKGRANAFFASVKACFYACQNAGNIPFTYAFHKCQTHKGIDDYLVANLAKTSEITNELKNLSNDDKKYFYSYDIKDIETLGDVKRKFDESSCYFVNEYLSERLDILGEMIASDGKSFMLNAPTGTGKTDTAMYLINEMKKQGNKRRIFFFVPTQALAEKMQNEYTNAINNYHKLSLNLATIYEKTDTTIKANLANDIDNYDVIVCVPNSYKFIKELITDDSLVIFDEVHKCITQHNIAPLQDIQDVINLNCTKVFMSGTPFESFTKEFELESINFVRLENNNVNLKYVVIHNKIIGKGFNFTTSFSAYHKAILNYVSCLEQKGKVHFIYLNHKIKQSEIKVKIEKEGRFDVEIINSEIDRKESKAYQSLVNSKPIELNNNKSLIVLCTSFVYEGVNLVNENDSIDNFAIFGEPYVANILQALARPRNAKQLNVFIFNTHKPKERPYFKRFYEYQKDVLSHAHEHKKALLRSESIKKALQIIGKNAKDLLYSNDKYNIANKDVLKKLHQDTLKAQKTFLANDISKLITPDGQINRIKMIAMYEAEKAQYETNKQKFDAIKKAYSNSEMVEITANEIYTLFLDDNAGEQEVIIAKEIASNNEKIVLEITENAKVKRQNDKAFFQAILSENLSDASKNDSSNNAILTLALFADPDVKFRRTSEMKNFVFDVVSSYNSGILNSIEYENFKSRTFNNDKKIDLNDNDFFKLIQSRAKRLRPLQKHFNLNSEFLQSKQFNKIMKLSNIKFKDYLVQLDTMQDFEKERKFLENDKALVSDMPYIFDISTIDLYKNVYKKLNDIVGNGKAYTRKELIQMCKSVYEIQVIKEKYINIDITFNTYQFKPLKQNFNICKKDNLRVFYTKTKQRFAPINLNDKNYIQCLKALFVIKERKVYCSNAKKRTVKYEVADNNAYEKLRKLNI